MSHLAWCDILSLVIRGRRVELHRLRIELLHERRVFLCVKDFCQIISCIDGQSFRAAEEGGYLVDMAGGGVVGTTAGVNTALTQLTQFTGGGGVATVGNNPMLASAVDAIRHIAEVELLLIANANEAGAGEEITINRDSYFSLANSTLCAGVGRVFFVNM